MKPRLETLLIVSATAIYFAWLAWGTIDSASQSERLVDVFNTDEAIHLRLLKEVIADGSMKIDFRPYGHLPFNMALVSLYALKPLITIDDQAIIISLRLVSLFAAFGTVLVTYLIGKRFFGPTVAWLSASFLCVTSGEFIKWSIHSHPDIPQVFFLILSLYFCCRFSQTRAFLDLSLAATMAGLAFACKYAGLFILPLIGLIALGHLLVNSHHADFARGRRLVGKMGRPLTGLLGAASIALGFVISVDLVAKFVSNDGIVDQENLQFIPQAKIILLSLGLAMLIATAIPWVWRRISQSPPLSLLITQFYCSVLCFSAAALITTPYSFWKLNFLKGMVHTSRNVAFGHVVRQDSGVGDWVGIMISRNGIGVILTVLATIGLVQLVSSLAKKDSTAATIWRAVGEAIVKPEVILWCWVLLYIGVLLARFRYGAPRYLLPVIPVLVLLALAAVVQLSRDFHQLLGKRSTGVITVVLGIAILLGWMASFADTAAYRAQVRSRVSLSQSVQAGLWLESEYDSEVRVLSDHYAYVPASLPNVVFTWAGSEAEITSFQPDLILVSNKISVRFEDPDLASHYRRGPDEYMEHHSYYLGLRSGSLGYEKVRDFGEVSIFRRES